VTVVNAVFSIQYIGVRGTPNAFLVARYPVP
jgi:hypothetical protein